MHKLFVAVIALLAATLAVPSQAAALDRLRGFVEGTKSGKADFVQTVASKSGRKPQNAAGSMMFSRPGKFRWTYDKPYYQLIVGDGEKLWVYDRALNQVSARKVVMVSPVLYLTHGAKAQRNAEALRALRLCAFA